MARPDRSEQPVGSSPLTRGKPGLRCHQYFVPGLIPAHAGKTLNNSRSPSSKKAHPRSRGENAPRSDAWLTRCGSSPLTRGKQVQDGPTPRGEGLIPAHAGKTVARVVIGVPSAAHPRSRGENTFGARIAATAAGSSPLTRGKPGPGIDWVRPARLIPAHAGKTQSGRGPPVAG